MDEYFERYMGRIFYNIINDNFKRKINTVVELGPGFKYKVACALQVMNFDGTIYVIDSNEEVLKYIKTKYEELLQYAKVVCIKADFKEAIKQIPKDIDLFLCNHIFDDMVISKYLEGENLKEAFDNDNESKYILTDAWRELSTSIKLQSIKNEVVEDFKTFFRNINVKFTIISNYKSGYYVNNKNFIEDLLTDIFAKMRKLIKTDVKKLNKSFDFYMDEFDESLKHEELHLKNNIQNTKNWIVGEYNEL